MLAQNDVIVDIPENRVQFFGGTGKMLLPSPATIAAVIQRIPETKVITTVLLRQTLTETFEVQGTCPITTQKALQVVANEGNEDVAYWRVLNANGGLIARFPGGKAGHAAQLRDEGFEIEEANGKMIKVKGFEEKLAQLG
jgi:alkylated DNA nucleotide flippase Atl1